MNNNTIGIPRKILSRKEEITSDFLRLYAEHLEALFAGKVRHRMTVKEFAERLFIHPRHLTNTLKITTGQSPSDLMEEAILLEAKRLLKESNWTIARIGMQFAYEEPTNFTKFFKGMTGQTPLQFRKVSRQPVVETDLLSA